MQMIHAEMAAAKTKVEELSQIKEAKEEELKKFESEKISLEETKA